MKIRLFTKTIYRSTFITSFITNVLTSILLFIVCMNLISDIYKSQYSKSIQSVNDYVNRILNNNDIYIKIMEYENSNGADSSVYYDDLISLVKHKNSLNDGLKIYLNKKSESIATLNNNELGIYNKYFKLGNIDNKIIEYGDELYIYTLRQFSETVYLHFFSFNEFFKAQNLYKKDGLIGLIFNDKKYFYYNDNVLPNNKTIVQKQSVNRNLQGLSFYYSKQKQYKDILTLFLVILLFSSFRFFIQLLNAKGNIRKIIKPLDELVKNTEKLAAHEVCEKLNRFDYPYNEFKQLAEAFNKVLLSRELSEIKLFRSFEQMESVVHKRTQELITTNEQLTIAMKKAEEANALKSQFLANISHEIRTPLNCIMGFCDIILTEDHSASVTEQVKHILHESETLLHLINDFLDYSKIDAGKMSLIETEVDIRSLINSLMKSGQIQAGDKTLVLFSNIDSNVPNLIISDELRLYQVVSNIFYNAIKFTPTGSINIKISCENGDFEDIKTLSISVIDTGIGIPKSNLNSIFNKFEQVDGSLTRKYRGSGLGLTICKKILELMEGTITVESEVNRGSIFKIELPVKFKSLNIVEDENLSMLVEATEHTEGSQILLVEDYPVNQIVAKKHLEMDNHIVTIAENGEEALDLCTKIQFDLILMDLQMPIMDGFKATKYIRGSNGLNSRTPILAMTANAMDTAKQTCLDTGMNGIITKPIRKKMFLREVDKWLKLSTR